jgi:hypothetical protein
MAVGNSTAGEGQSVCDEDSWQGNEPQWPPVPRDRPHQQANGNNGGKSDESQNEQHEWQLD